MRNALLLGALLETACSHSRLELPDEAVTACLQQIKAAERACAADASAFNFGKRMPEATTDSAVPYASPRLELEECLAEAGVLDPVLNCSKPDYYGHLFVGSFDKNK